MTYYITRISAFLLFLFSSLFNSVVSAKNPGSKNSISFRSDCIMPQATINMEINNIRVKLSINGYFQKQIVIETECQNSDLDNPFSPLAYGNLWLGGYDSYDNLRLAANLFPNSSRNDYWAGPINPETRLTDLNTCNEWDKLFSVLGQSILAHQTKYEVAKNSGLEYKVTDIPLDILGWPGVGNPFFESVHGFQIPTYISSLAPFYDLNADGVYNPQHGDFPINNSKNLELSDYLNSHQQMVFSIKNDVGNIHTGSSGHPIGAEIKTLTFGFKTGNALNEMIFFNTKVTNHGNDQLKEFYAGIFSDTELSCWYFTDNIGFDSTRNMCYVYAEDYYDYHLAWECVGIESDCSFAPAAGIRLFEGFENSPNTGVSSFMYFLNTGIGALPRLGPSNAPEYYKYLNGIWRDGTRLTYGGNGYNPQSIAYCNYAYPSNPASSSPESWSMCTNPMDVRELRMLMSMGPVELNIGETNEFTFGTVASKLPNNSCPDISKLLEDSDVAAGLFTSGTVSTHQQDAIDNQTKLFPNPYFKKQFDKTLNLNFQNLPAYAQLTLMDAKGRILALNSINNEAQGSYNWLINQSDLPTGLYFVKVAQNNRTYQILKLIIME